MSAGEIVVWVGLLIGLTIVIKVVIGNVLRVRVEKRAKAEMARIMNAHEEAVRSKKIKQLSAAQVKPIGETEKRKNFDSDGGYGWGDTLSVSDSSYSSCDSSSSSSSSSGD